MTIAHKFVNWSQATISAAKACSDMEFCISHSRQAISDADSRMYNPKGTNLSREPVSGGTSKAEDTWINCIDAKQNVQSKLQDAEAYMAWFKPAWNRLKEEERILIEERYMIQRINGERWVISASNRVPYERTRIYEKSDEAIRRLTTMLYAG